MMLRHKVVLPEDSGPKTSMMRPRGSPPTPSARSIAREPVGRTETFILEASPMRMRVPSPNCLLMVEIARLSVCVLVAITLSIFLVVFVCFSDIVVKN